MYRLEEFHDVNISGIKVNGNTDVMFFLENDKCLLNFYNVKHMKINNFMLGNIIFEINVYNNATDIKNINHILCWLYDIENTNLTAPWVVSIINKISNNSLILVELIESYGAYGAIICETYTINI